MPLTAETIAATADLVLIARNPKAGARSGEARVAELIAALQIVQSGDVPAPGNRTSTRTGGA